MRSGAKERVGAESRSTLMNSATVDNCGTTEGRMAELHQRGVDLVVELLDAADHPEMLPDQELRNLLRRAAFVLGDLLVRDVVPDLKP